MFQSLGRDNTFTDLIQFWMPKKVSLENRYKSKNNYSSMRGASFISLCKIVFFLSASSISTLALLPNCFVQCFEPRSLGRYFLEIVSSTSRTMRKRGGPMILTQNNETLPPHGLELYRIDINEVMVFHKGRKETTLWILTWIRPPYLKKRKGII
jgi:hypothetical protein